MVLREFVWANNYLIMLILYYISFLLVPIIVNKNWYGQNPKEIFQDPKDQNELIKNTLEQHKFLESTSYVFAGSALVGLTFIVSLNLDNLNFLEPAITFFAIGFISETISGFSFRDMRTNFWGHFGQVLQYGGIISILMGFEVFIFTQEILRWSTILQLLFPIGMTFIVYLTYKQLKAKLDFLNANKK